MLKNFIRDNAFIEYDIFKFFFIINDYVAYFVIFVFEFIYFEHFIIKKIMNNINVEFDVIKV